MLALSASIAGLAAVCTSVSTAAPAESPPLRIELDAPEVCPARPTLFERVRSHTPRVRGASPGETARALRVVIRPEADRFVADLRLVEDGEALERRVPGKTCEEVLAAVALITALAIDPLASPVPTDAGVEIEDAAATSEASAETPVVVPRAEASEADAGHPPPARARLHLTMGVSLDAYGLGELVLGRSAFVEGALATRMAPALRLRLGRTQSFTEERDLLPASFRLTSAAVEGCATVLRSTAELDGTGKLELRPCAQMSGGVFEGASSAFGLHRMPRPWFSLAALAQARWRFFGPLELEAALGLSLPLVRDNFFFLPRNDVYRAPGVVLLGNVGVGTTFP